MKKLSISTFWIFFMCLCLRAYSYLSYNELKDKVNTSESLLNDDKKKTIALLNTLNDLTQRNTNSNDNYKEVTSDYLNNQRIKNSIIINFIEDFYASKDNLSDLKSLQQDIKTVNKKLEVINSPLEYLDIELLYYFVLRESFDLRDFQKTIIFEDLGFDRERMAKIRKIASSRDFKKEILIFKNVYTEEIETLENHSNLKLSKIKEEVSIDKEIEEKPGFEFLKAAEEQEVNLEKKLIELDYTAEEVEEMLSGFEL